MARAVFFASALFFLCVVRGARRIAGVDDAVDVASPAALLAGGLQAPESPVGVAERGGDAEGFLGAAFETEGPADDEDYSFEFPGNVIARKVVWLIRHGEAVHNIEEDRAAMEAADEAARAGHDPSSAEFVERVAAARRAALSNAHLHDAALTEEGKAQVEAARAVIEGLVHNRHLPMPTRVLTSPLQRALQTTAIIFPDHPGVHMRECLRERRTGLPCDERQPAVAINKRASFAFMSSLSLLRLEHDGLTVEGGREETKPKLRSRTFQIIDELLSFPDISICVVTHKAWLRELERGPFNRPGASEFRNCEVRAYDVEMLTDGHIEATLIYAGDDPAGIA